MDDEGLPPHGVVLTSLLGMIRNRGIQEPNLFRTSRSIEDVRGLWGSLVALVGDGGDQGEQEIQRRLAEEPDVHLVSAVVMHHLKVTSSLIPTRLYEQVLEADLSSDDEEIMVVGLRCLLQSVPRPEWKQLKALVRFLWQTAQSSHLNELPVQSLAFLFAPLLTRPEGSAYMSVRHLQGLGKLRQVLQLLIEHHEEVFAETGGAVPATQAAAPVAMLQAPVLGVEVVTLLVSNIVGEFMGSASRDGHDQQGSYPTATVVCTDSHVPAGDPVERNQGNVYCRWAPARKTMAHERRRMVQACRTLRMQIKRFEDAFQRQHGHLPKGVERAPLASTYCQYREWKKNIRDHAAAQVQALFRGWKTRSAARHRERPTQLRRPTAESSRPLRDRPDDRLSDGPNENRILGGMADMASLQQEKKLVKQKLKSFDQEFAAEHGRMPTKSEKEPIRDLYELYHEIKLRIKAAEELRRSSHAHAAVLGEEPTGEPVKNPTMRQLELERLRLHDKLKLYEKQFQRNFGRPVTSVEDIAAVASDYSRYRELKRIGNAPTEHTKVGASIRC